MNVIREDLHAQELRAKDDLRHENHALSMLLARALDYVDHFKSCPRHYASVGACDCGLSALRRAINEI